MTKVEFYFDPACPWSWVTSRWLLSVREHRDINITWRPFSLAIKNDSLVKKDGESPYTTKHRASHRVLRLMMEASKNHGVSLEKMYTHFGIKHHIAGFDYSDEWILATLKELDLPASLLSAGDKTDYDQELSREIDSATEVAGNDVGVPIIVFTNEKEERQGYFGPVIRTIPETKEALKLWDGLHNLATVSSFYELKRGRPDGGPDTSGPAIC